MLLKALRVVAAGGAFADPTLALRLPDGPRRPVRTGVALLSPREREILGMLAEGRSGAEIAQRLFLSAETVRTHVRNAVQKLGARTRTQAVALVVGAEAGPRAPI
jgi:DNA-binding NarL/FixJ family response regulator